MKAKRTSKYGLIALVTLGLAYLLSRNGSKSFLDVKTSPFLLGVKNQIVNLLVKLGYSERMAYNWFLIANMETAGFTSELFRVYHNPWGMKQPKKRLTKSKGPVVLKGSEWATFYNLDDAIIDLVMYMEEFKYPNDFSSLDEQLKFMKSKGYFEEPGATYQGLVIAWANKKQLPLVA